jgi:hypothetical protein
MNGGRPTLPIAMLALAAVALAAGRAQAATVVVVRPAGAATELTETVSRLHGELLSLGLEVVFTDRGDRGDRGDAAPPPTADAVLDIIIGDGTPAAVDICVFDRRRGTSEISRVALEPGVPNAPGRLAIRAVEVLRSRLAEIDLSARDPRARDPRAPAVPAPPPAVVAPAAAAPPASVAPRFGLEAGAAVLTSLDGVGPALLPIARFGWTAGPRLVLQATLAGLGSRPAVTTPAGSARVAQHYGMFGVCVCAPAAQPIGPFATVAAGVLRTAVDGQADAPELAHFVARWSLLVEASAGARVRLPGRYFLATAAHVQLAEPYIAIHFVDTLVATSGRPNLLVSLTAGAWM